MPSKICSFVPRACHWALLGVLSTVLLTPGTAQEAAHPQSEPPFQPDRIIAIPKSNRSEAVRVLHTKTGGKVLKSFPRLGGIHVLEVPSGTDARELVDRYRRSGEFEAVDLNYVFTPTATPNDPRVLNGEEWHLNNVGQSSGIPDADIDAFEAWDTLHSATNVIVAILDSGLRQTHQDLADNLWINPGEIPGNNVDDDLNGIIDDVHGVDLIPGPATGNPEDDLGHGTHVAGIIGAVGNNGLGCSGVAWKVPLMPLRFLSAQNGSLNDALEGLDYARSKGARVINCSFEVPTFVGTLSNAMWQLRNDGIIIVAAAGNSNMDIDVNGHSPGGFKIDNVISVMATTRSDGRWSSSNFGATSVHLGAPGHQIISTYIGSDSSYTLMSGTSMASPCVAGAVALLCARFPSWDYRQIIQRLLTTVEPVPALAGLCKTGGRLNLRRALGEGDFTNQPVAFSWIPTNAMTPLTLTGDGASAAIPLPFNFRFYGEDHSQVFLGANGLAAFANAGLSASLNTDLPNTNLPNAVLYPFWDDLDPAAGGRVWFGQLGTPPNRKFVATWADIPHSSGSQTRFTFQMILHETREVVFQYAQVQNGNNALVRGKSATIGMEDATAALATRYSFNSSSGSVTNNQAILFMPKGALNTGPNLSMGTILVAGQRSINLSGQPGRRYIVSASQNLTSWTHVETNTLPGSGVASWTDPEANSNNWQFYRAVFEP